MQLCLASVSHLLILGCLPLLSKLAVSAEGQGQGWVPGHALGGHYGAVVDMCWGVDGSCLLTASTDQTCRISVQNEGRWSELARPQARLTTCSEPHHHRHLKVCTVQNHVVISTKAFKAFFRPVLSRYMHTILTEACIPLLCPHKCECLTHHSFHHMYDLSVHAHRYMGMTCLA